MLMNSYLNKKNFYYYADRPKKKVVYERVKMPIQNNPTNI